MPSSLSDFTNDFAPCKRHRTDAVSAIAMCVLIDSVMICTLSTRVWCDFFIDKSTPVVKFVIFGASLFYGT